MKRKELTGWLRAVILIGGMAVIGVSATFVPAIGQKIARYHASLAYLYWPCLIGTWIAVLPVLYVGLQAWRMTRDLSRDKAFSEENVKRMRTIAWAAMADVVFVGVGMMVLFALSALHLGLVLPALTLLFVGVAVAAVARTLAHLMEKAAEAQREVMLTV